MNINNLDFDLLAFNPEHEPDIGSWFLLKTSYCNECYSNLPCDSCLRMCNRFVISSKHKTTNGYLYFFNGGLCSRDGGILLNSTYSAILADNLADYDENDPYMHYIYEAKFINIPVTYIDVLTSVNSDRNI